MSDLMGWDGDDDGVTTDDTEKLLEEIDHLRAEVERLRVLAGLLLIENREMIGLAVTRDGFFGWPEHEALKLHKEIDCDALVAEAEAALDAAKGE